MRLNAGTGFVWNRKPACETSMINSSVSRVINSCCTKRFLHIFCMSQIRKQKQLRPPTERQGDRRTRLQTPMPAPQKHRTRESSSLLVVVGIVFTKISKHKRRVCREENAERPFGPKWSSARCKLHGAYARYIYCERQLQVANANTAYTCNENNEDNVGQM